ncbi:MAG: alpha/beta fold hydrolase [Verrucomicrobia bacterium]|nr:alpha/beta fold hydrolase [Verrucomicrobiota bacterium]
MLVGWDRRDTKTIVSARAVPKCRIVALAGLSWFRKAFVWPIGISLTLVGCVHVEKQRTAPAPPLATAERRLAQAEKQRANLDTQAGEFLAIAKIADEQLSYGHDTEAEKSSALTLYNRATADLAANLPSLIRQEQNSGTLSVKDSRSGQMNRLELDSGRPGEYPATYFQKILLADRVDKKGMRDNVIRPGLGGRIVGIHHSSEIGTAPPRLEPLKGIRATVTAVLDFGPSGSGAIHLRLLDPTKIDQVVLNGKSYPLAADYTAAEASYGRINETWIGFMNMIRGEHMRGAAGVLLLQPYDSEKIPVIFVHGLLSSPYAWRNVANSLSVDPEIRRRYQFWVFSYSTGNPIAYSALLLRQDLAYAEQTYHFNQAILIGHSMGGILSRLQVTNTSRVLWDGIFGPKAEAVYASQPQNSVLKQALIFSANPEVKRVIFVATPHRGSTLANGSIGALGMRLIRLPLKIVNAIPRAAIAALTPDNDPKKFRPPNSITGLSPKNPLLLALDKLPIEAPHNSIIGDRGRGDTPNSSDGVVPFWSSHLDSAQSELIVPTDHGAMNHPRAVEEMRRILLRQLGSSRSQETTRNRQSLTSQQKVSPRFTFTRTNQ